MQNFMRLVLPFLLIALLYSCKETIKKQEEKNDVVQEQIVEEPKYPETISKIFDVHGGLKAWRKNKTLTFDLPKKDVKETHTISLITRKDRVDTPDYSYGSDGKSVWKLDPKKVFKGDAVFYHNLYFYFYAMPFVLADEGIVYGETEPLEFEGVSYPGVKISYNSGVGTSPKDNYYIHYDPKTYKMQWLGYTVTYRSGAVSENIKWIRYNDWMKVDDVVLPKSITWHNYEGRTIKEAERPVIFENVKLSTEENPDSFYAIPEEGEVVLKE